jgi:hypothetical protein
MFGSMASYYLDNEMGSQVDQAEAMLRMKQSRDCSR